MIKSFSFFCLLFLFWFWGDIPSKKRKPLHHSARGRKTGVNIPSASAFPPFAQGMLPNVLRTISLRPRDVGLTQNDVPKFWDSQFAGRIVAFRPEGVVPYVEREETAIEKTKICLFGLTQNDVPKQSGRPSDFRATAASPSRQWLLRWIFTTLSLLERAYAIALRKYYSTDREICQQSVPFFQRKYYSLRSS